MPGDLIGLPPVSLFLFVVDLERHAEDIFVFAFVVLLENKGELAMNHSKAAHAKMKVMSRSQEFKYVSINPERPKTLINIQKLLNVWMSLQMWEALGDPSKK